MRIDILPGQGVTAKRGKGRCLRDPDGKPRYWLCHADKEGNLDVEPPPGLTVLCCHPRQVAARGYPVVGDWEGKTRMSTGPGYLEIGEW